MNEKYRILIADDEEDITEIFQFNFEKENFEVRAAGDGKSAVEMALNFKPHLILMDIMMPVMDGMKACQEIRQYSESYYPLICMLTARGEDYSKIAGFDSGADDFVVKPVSPKVLVTKMKALLKLRYGQVEAMLDTGETKDELYIDREYYSVYRNKEEIEFPRKEFEILSLIASRPNRLFRREEIYNHIWSSEAAVGDRTIDVYIRKIRSKIGDNYIKTVKGVGYKFIQ
jgi:two-component system alkaline phosphatase synthesis response regulator PhoP